MNLRIFDFLKFFLYLRIFDICNLNVVCVTYGNIDHVLFKVLYLNIIIYYLICISVVYVKRMLLIVIYCILIF